ADDHFPRLRADLYDVQRLGAAAGEAPALADRIAGESRVLADHLAAHRHQRAGGERRRIGGQMPLQHTHVIVIGDEADLDRLRLVGRDEPEAARDRAGLALGERTDRGEHAAYDRAVDAPQEVGLVLLRIAPAEQRAVARHYVM